MISINNIEENFRTFTRNSGYYETEIFTKFEDAFLAEVGAAPTGLTIIHGHRSKVSFAKMTGKWCELGDLLLLSYSTKKKQARMLLLQFKQSGRYKSGAIKVEIGPDQFALYETFPTVTGKNIPPNILEYENHVPKRGGAMFALLEEGLGGATLRIMNHSKLAFSRSTKNVHQYIGTGSLTKTSVGSLDFCEDIPSMGEFLQELKALHVGKDIAWEHAEKLLKEFVYPGQNRNGNNPNADQPRLGIRGAMFLDVDKLY